jgi:RHS repeat-associated protein
MAYDAARGQMVMFGGADPNINTAFNDTWAWDGINWTQKFPATSPPATSGHAMAYDAARQQVVMFGGAVGSTIVADTWVWDGANWTQKFPANMPSPRLHAAMAYDIARQQVVLFGGGPGSPTAFSDTWVWDGTNWTQKSPTTSPPARCCYGLAYDAVVGQTVLFGGTPDAINFYNDTWVWNGSTWTQKFPATIPTIPRFHHRLAYDTARQQTVLFGGQGPNNTPIYNDTWVWDRTNWTQQFPATSPPGHSLPAMAYDEARSQTVLFGGLSGTSFVNDTWVFGAPTSTTCPIGPPPTIISVSPSSGIQGQTITNFTVNGNNFDPAAVLFFSGTEIAANSYSSRTSTQIVASVSIANAAPTGLRDVSVMNPDGQQGTLSRSFSLLSPTAAIIPPTPVGTTGTPTDQQQTSQDPVSTGNGNYHFERTDFVVPGRGLPIVFQRNYNSLDNYSGPIGANWTHTYNITLFESQTGDVFTKWGDGHGETFALIGGNYVPQHGVFSALTKAPDGSFLLTRKDQSKYNFSSSGKLLSIQDKNGNAILLTYDGTGNLSRIADTVGRNVILSYDASNRITQVTDPASRVFSFTYDSNGNLATSTNPAAGVTRLSYDNNHRVTSITLPNNQLLLQNAYDTAGRVTSQTNGRSFTTTFAYGTPNTGDTTVSDPRANAAIHSYDASLRIVKITDAAGGSTTFTYDSNNDRTSVTNQNAKTTTFAYDARGNITGITDPLANSIAFTYDGKNNLLAATNAKAKTTSFVYDGNGNLTKIQDAVGHATTFSYNGFGQLVSKTDARGNTATFSYDTFANLTRITDALSHSTTLSYDSIGRLTSITDPNGHAATAAYDALSRLVTTNDPLANQTKFAYDAVGNLLKITDANGNTTIYAYDATNNLVSVTDALGHITRYAYDANNNRVTSTNAKGNATSYTYDVLNRLNRIVDPLSFAAVYAYDPVGNVLAVTDAKGQTNQFTYDALNRLLGILYADGKNVAYSYDANGNRTSMVDSHGTTAYSYDDLDRLTSVTHPGGKVVAYAHDPIGNRSSLTYADGKIVNYAYDAANRLSGVMDWLGRRTTYSYDAASNLTGTAYPNQAALAFVYDSANRLTQVSNSYRGSVDNPITSFTYMLDAIGNRLQVTDGSGKSTFYGYDLLYQLDSVRVGSGANVTRFTYDAVGNRLSLNAPNTFINYTYDAADRLLAAGTASFTYDANGNQTSKTQTATGQPIVYSYDAANRLVQARGGAVNSTFAYDGDGNRITQSVGTGTYSYLNDVATALPVVLQESGPDGNISYAYGLGLVSELGSTFDAFYQYDGLGTVVGLTDPTGKLLGRYGYDAWGQTDLSAPGPQLGTKNKFRFTGEALDPGTQLYYLRARYYDPSVGRFASRDLFAGLVGEPLTINKFLYVLNRPVTFSDPSGLAAEKTPATGDTFAPVTNVSLVSNNANSTISTAPTSNASRSASTRAIATACKAIDIVETIFEKTSEFIANRTLNYIYSNGGTQSVSDVPCYSQIPGVGLFFNNVPTAQ